MNVSNINLESFAQARWLSWLEREPVHQKVCGLVSGQGTYRGFGFEPQSRHIREETNGCFSHINVLLALFLNKLKTSSGEDKSGIILSFNKTISNFVV